MGQGGQSDSKRLTALFSFSSPQAIHFGRGQSAQTAAIAATFGSAVLLIHGAQASRAQWLIAQCQTAGLTVQTLACPHEPSLPDVEQALGRLGSFRPDVVIGLGGGSVMDFAKALSALLPCKGPPLAYLEVVGDGRALDHAPIPMMALPTTAGTGAEVTKNAVISVPTHGIKVSLRDTRMVPAVAIVDPALMQGAPRRVALSAGLDAVTQVIEPYLSIKANIMTDALCLKAIPEGLRVLRTLVEDDATEAWDRMAWVSTCGGLALANAGLGAVHGFAGVIGGATQAPHGEICGALLPSVMQSHLQKAQAGTDIHARVCWVNSQIDTYFGADGIARLAEWSKAMGLRGLGDMGLLPADFASVAAASAGASSMKGNPFKLSEPELIEILQAAYA